MQVVLARVEVPWRLIDLSDCEAAEQQQRLTELSMPTAWSGSILRRRR